VGFCTRGSRDREALSPDVALDILPSDESQPDLEIGEAEVEPIRDFVELVSVGIVVVPDPAVIGLFAVNRGSGWSTRLAG
jgi:hypothetical protein